MDEPDFSCRTAVIITRWKKLSLEEKAMHTDPGWGTPSKGFNFCKFRLSRNERNALASFFSVGCKRLRGL
jgi:hypothetical protein